MKTFITFGQGHAHAINGRTFDKDSVAVIKSESAERGREIAFELFGPQFCFEYPEHVFDFTSMHYFPRGFLMAYGECEDPGRPECDCHLCGGGEPVSDKTDDEILQRIKERKLQDFFGFELPDLITRLPFDKAKEFLRPEVTEEEWEVWPRDKESLIKEMHDYMPFAWDKANSCRGISAGRSMSHFMSWTWLAGDDFGDLTDYEHYGKPNLVRLCEHYGWDHAQWDDGIRSNSEY